VNFPPGLPLIGGGMLHRLIAIVHVFVAHFASRWIVPVWTESRAYRRK